MRNNLRHLPFVALILTGLLSVAAAPIRQFRFEGNTVYSTAELTKLTTPFLGREATREELEDARRAVTLHYVNHGYLNSGAILPPQDFRDGIVTVKIVEGKLSSVHVTGNKWLRDNFLTPRIQRWAGPPLNMDRLRTGLQILRQDPNLTQINAKLEPGTAPGQSRLDVQVADQQPFRVGLQLDNYRPPSVGSTELLLLLADLNLTGHGDPLVFDYGIATASSDGARFSELGNLSGSYAFPLTSYNTTLHIFGSKSDFTVVEEPFTTLAIEGRSYRVGAALRQPFYLSDQREFALAISFERRHSETFLLGQPFDITPGSVHGVNNISALRFSQEWTDRSLNHVLALRSTFSFGLDVLDATDDGSSRNAKFFAWLGQVQYIRRLFNTPNQLIFRTDAQLTSNPLLSLEQLSIGGPTSVHGYRQNQLVRDQGVVSSVELRVPVMFDRRGAPILQLAPFFDIGAGWNNAAPTPSPTAIPSIGIGLILTPHKRVTAEMYWGYALTKIDLPHNDPQDSGFVFRVRVDAF